MTKKRILPPDRLAECKAAHDLFLAKKNELKLSQRKVAEAAGMTAAAVNLYFKGINPLNAQFAAVLSELLQEPVAKFSPRLAAEMEKIAQAVASSSDSHASQHEANVAPAFRAFKKSNPYPVISWIAAGERAESPDNFNPGGTGLSFVSDQNAGEHGYWLEVKGKSMTSDSTPSFLPGTFVLVQPEGFDLISGKYYIAQHQDGETTFKQYVYDAGAEYLVPLNSAYSTVKLEDEWEIIGRVIDIKVTGL